MKLVVGLGNPGPDYARTRHNIGRRVVEAVAARIGAGAFEPCAGGQLARGRLAEDELVLLRPDTFMNASGDAVAAVVHDLGLATPERDLLVVLDDLDLPLGRLRVRPAGRDGGQRGLRHVIACLGTEQLPRLRVGVSRPPVGVAPLDWVLQDFSAEDEGPLGIVLPRAVDAVLCFARHGVAAAMDAFNAPIEPQRGSS